MGNRTKEDELYREMCRVVGKVVLEMRDLGQEPKHIVLRTALANKRIQRSELEKQAMETVINALVK
ncbi:fumarate hydratase FumD [Escherichia coli]